MKDDLSKLTSEEATHRDHILYFDTKADPGFVKRHNDDVIERTIKKHEANIFKKRKGFAEQVAERSDVVASYLKSRWAQEGNPIDTYITRELMAQMRGQKRIEKIHRLQNGKKVITFDELN